MTVFKQRLIFDADKAPVIHDKFYESIIGRHDLPFFVGLPFLSLPSSFIIMDVS